jgi:signal transduction histidine kinase
VAVSPNSQWVASGTWNGHGVKVWEFATRRQIAELPVDTSAAVAFSPDGHLLVTSSRDYRVWECGSWRELYRGPESGGVVGPAAAFSPDGRLLAVSKALHVVELLDPGTGKLLAALEAPGSPFIAALRFTPDSTKLLALEWTRPILVWDLPRIHEELAKLGLDWDTPARGGPEARQIALRAGSPPAVVGSVSPHQSSLAAQSWVSPISSRTGIWLYVLPITALIIGIAIALYTLQYHQRMMRSYEEVESLAAERNRALDAARAELVHSQKMRALGTLAAGIAHDFNNLLSIIRMGNNLLRRREVSAEEKAESSQAVEGAVEQGKKIVRSMLGYSREQSDAAEPYSVADLVNETGLLLNQQFLSGVTLTLELNRDLPLVTGRRGRLEQILLNLIVNAAEAMNGQGRLRIAARAASSVEGPLALQPGPAPQYVELVVEDTGPGIEPEIREQIFEPFFSTKPRGASSGTGLGLSLVHSLAEQEKMGVGLKSELGRGTTFTIWIPVAEIPYTPVQGGVVASAA